MQGDKYHVHYSIKGVTSTEPNGPWDTWADAKAMRDDTFMLFKEVQACWIMRFNPSLGLGPEKYGHVLKRHVKRTA